MSHPKATGNRRSANQKLMLPIHLWYECLQAAEGCYFDPACRVPSIDAHALSKSWLNHALADDAGRVYSFSRAKGLLTELYEPLFAREEKEKLVQAQRQNRLDWNNWKGSSMLALAQRQAYPGLVYADMATVAGFCCCTHDSGFFPIDCLEVRDHLSPSALDERSRNLLFHRALIRQLHKNAAFKVYRRKLRWRYPKYPFRWNDTPNWDRHSPRFREILLEVLNGERSSWRVRHIPGAPQVAACGVGSWGSRNSDVWGCTVVPHAGGHLVAYHYCTAQPLPRAWEEQARMERSPWAEMFRAAACEPRRISRFLLTECKELCLAPAAWCNWDKGKQTAVRDLFFSTITGQFGPPLATIPDINLFA